ncbi:MAG: hypothetical protein ACI4CT_07425 [Lachnospiraceae bacterium]
MKKIYVEPEMTKLDFSVEDIISISAETPAVTKELSLQTMTWNTTAGITEFDYE